MRIRMLCGLVLGLIWGCDGGSGGVDGPADAVITDTGPLDTSPQPADDGADAAIHDAAPLVDRGLIDAEPSPADGGAAGCTENGSITLDTERVTLRSWGRDRPGVVRVAAQLRGSFCGPLRAISDDPMVGGAVAHDGLRVWLEPDALRSGRRSVELRIGTGQSPALATLTVDLDIWAPAPPDAPRHALLIGIDGVRSDGFVAARTPNIDRLATAGDWTVEATTQLEGPTSSGPGWASILTGVDVGRHGVVDNADVNLDPAYPSFLHRVRRDMGLSTAGALQWAPLLVMVGRGALDVGRGGDHDGVTGNMREMLRDGYRALFVHFDDVDHAGHDSGFSVDNPDYLGAIERVDTAVGTLMDQILARPDVADESWLIVVTSDHGGRGRGHGPQDREHRRIPFVVSGPSVVPGTMGGASHTDAAVTLLAHLGYPLDPGLGLQGRVRGLAGEFACDDAIDDDGDGALDCDDPDCDRAPVCGGIAPEICQNNRDDDGDGGTDCADDDCAEHPACTIACDPVALGGSIGRAVFAEDSTDRPAVARSSCGGDGPEVALSWVAPADDVYLFDTFDSAIDTVLTLRAGDCVGPELACNDQAFGSVRDDTPLPAQSAVRLPLDAGEALTIVLDSGPLGGGEVALDITRMGADCPDGDLGDAVGDALIRGETTGGRTRYLGSCAGTARDAVYRWAAPAAGDYVIDTVGSDFDTVLMVLEGACGEVERACNDDASGLQSVIELAGVGAGEVFTLVVSGFRGRNGAYRLNISGP